MDKDTEQTLRDMAERMERMEKFITRRFDEVSNEIHATCQMVDMAEAEIGKRFGEILAVLGAITFRGDGTSPHNVGVELDAVVKTTEDAANRILDSAQDIRALMSANAIDWNDASARQALFTTVQSYTDSILTACAFQDLTGQRIGKTLERIRHAERELAEMLDKMGLKVDFGQGTQQANVVPAVPNDNLSTQDDVDALFR